MDDSFFLCPIWGTPAELIERNGDSAIIMSVRAGGLFNISRTAQAIVSKSAFPEWKKVALTEQIFLAQLQNIQLKIDSRLIESLRRMPPLSVQAKLDRFFVTICDKFPIIGKELNIRELAVNDDGFAALSALRLPGTLTENANEVALFVEAMVKKKLLTQNAGSDPQSPIVRISLDGWSHRESLGVSLSTSNQIFVAMWFGSQEQSDIYNKAIAPVIEATGYHCVRIDNTEHNDKIDDAIIAEIRKSKAVIVDLTCGLATPIGGWSEAESVGAPRGGVFYEAGFAVGFGLPVIWTVKQEISDVENVVHFDVRQFNQIRWTDDLEDFRVRLKNRIEATLGRGNSK